MTVETWEVSKALDLTTMTATDISTTSYSCSPTLSPDGLKLLNNYGRHEELEIHDWPGAANTLKISSTNCAPDTIWDCFHFSNHNDFVVFRGDRVASPEVYVLQYSSIRAGNPKFVRVTWGGVNPGGTGPANWPDMWVGSVQAPTQHSLSVIRGTGDTTCLTGTQVTIQADAAPTDSVFHQWTGDISAVADVSQATTTVTMPASDVTVTATYRWVDAPVEAPSNLQLQLNYDGASVDLLWTDNSLDETGFVVERALNGGTFTPVDTLAANTSFCTDDALPTGTLAWRVKAVRGADASPYSNEAGCTITGQPAFAVTSPTAGDTIISGGTLRVMWVADLSVVLDGVLIKLSLDNGETWEVISPSAAIDQDSPDWCDWTWQVPAGVSADSAMVGVQEYNGSGIVMSGAITIVDPNAAMLPRVTVPRSATVRISQYPSGVVFAAPTPLSGHTRVDVFDVRGSRVFAAEATDGSSLVWSTAQAPAGRYLVRAVCGEETVEAALSVVR